MAYIEFNPGADIPRGKQGNLLYRHYPTKVVVGPLPDYSKRRTTAKQKTNRQRFKLQWAPLAHQLLADPKEKAACQRLAEQNHWHIWNAAISRASRAGH